MSGPTAISVKEVFLAAREMAGSARASYLTDACAADPAGRRRVEALLRAETALGPELLAPAPAVPVVMEEIDRYELMDVLGEGGFGTVYRAKRRGGVETEVALKVLRAGVESGEALARFRIEQRSLEAMDHPGIARVLDAGLTRIGRPYLVMELVRGEAVTAFCDRERLSIAERIALMADVCRAVQHAHHKGVIHRDLKPSNILAWRSEGEGGRVWVKVIDFGVAKAIGNGGSEAGTRTAVTQSARAIGTPAYMSPEQAQGGQDVDTRADVYALGAVLYELLCGSAVIDAAALAGASPGEVERRVCEVEPRRPSERVMCDPPRGREAAAAARGVDVARLHRSLRGELDWITLRALEKDRTRRYPTTEALAADLERVARGEAVEAAPPSRVYRLSRLIRRNRGAAAGIAVAALALVIGAAAALYQGVQARAAEREADRQRRVAEAVNRFLQDDLLSAASPDGQGQAGRGRLVTMREVLDEASRRIDDASAVGGTLANQPQVQAAIHRTLAETQYGLGELDKAAKHAEAWWALAREARGDESEDALMAMTTLAAIKGNQSHGEEAERLLLTAIDTATRRFGPEADVTIFAQNTLAAQYTVGPIRLDRSEELFRRVLEANTRKLGSEHRDTLGAACGLGHVLVSVGRPAEAEAIHRDVWERGRRTLGETHPETIYYKLGLARAVYACGPAREQEAIALYREIIDARREVIGPEHFETLTAMHELADIHLRARRLADAESMYRAEYDGLKGTLGDDHEQTIRCESALGEVLARKGELDQALVLLKDSVARMDRVYGGGMRDSDWVRWRLDMTTKARDQGSTRLDE